MGTQFGHSSQKGGVLVETAISLSLLLVFLMGSVNLERLITTSHVLTQVARNTARIGIALMPPSAMMVDLEDASSLQNISDWYCFAIDSSGRKFLDDAGLSSHDYRIESTFESIEDGIEGWAVTRPTMLTVHIKPNVADGYDLAKAAFIMDFKLPALPPCSEIQ